MGARKAKRPLWQRIMLRLCGLGLIAYIFWCVAIYFVQDSLIFPRSYAAQIADAETNLSANESMITITAADGTPLRGVLWLPTNIAKVESRAGESARTLSGAAPLVVWLHGNAERIEHVRRHGALEPYQNRRFAILLPEYRGYGPSAGEPSEGALASDVEAMIRAAQTDPRVDATRLVIHGRSLGGGVACAAARRITPDALVLESTFTSITAMSRRFFVPGFLVRHPFRNDKVVRDFAGPVLIMHGCNDSIVPYSHGEALAKLARDATFVRQECDHNDFPGRDLAGYDEALGAFLAKAGVIGHE